MGLAMAIIVYLTFVQDSTNISDLVSSLRQSEAQLTFIQEDGAGVMRMEGGEPFHLVTLSARQTWLVQCWSQAQDGCIYAVWHFAQEIMSKLHTPPCYGTRVIGGHAWGWLGLSKVPHVRYAGIVSVPTSAGKILSSSCVFVEFIA